MRARRAELEANPEHVDAILQNGATKARQEATEVLSRVREAMGL